MIAHQEHIAEKATGNSNRVRWIFTAQCLSPQQNHSPPGRGCDFADLRLQKTDLLLN
jgi:hypothetical protein